MIITPDKPEPKQRSTAQLWARRAKLKQLRAVIDAEIKEIETTLKAELEAE